MIIFCVYLFDEISFRYNIDRKFHDLENVDKSKAIDAKLINKNFKNLKWISKLDNPDNEVAIIIKAIKVIDKDDRKKTLITHYQFMSTILDKELNILNRWYLWDNNTHPTENHKYFKIYKKLINKNIKKNKIEVIYILSQKNEMKFENIKNYVEDICFENKTLIDNRFSIHEIKDCE